MAFLARAVTNSIGITIGNSQDIFGVPSCKTDSFIIPSNDSKIFAGECQSNFSITRETVVGNLIGHRLRDIDIIGSHIFNFGANLRQEAALMQSEKSYEVWTKGKRYKCIKGRVYYTTIKPERKG